jgi:hypothetical protein
VEEALRLGISDSAAVPHLLHRPDPEQRRQHAVALAEELLQFERPMPVMDNYDLLQTTLRGSDPMKNQTQALEPAARPEAEPPEAKPFGTEPAENFTGIELPRLRCLCVQFLVAEAQ